MRERFEGYGIQSAPPSPDSLGVETSCWNLPTHYLANQRVAVMSKEGAPDFRAGNSLRKGAGPEAGPEAAR